MMKASASDIYSFFFFNDTATTEIYTLSLHDALPICGNRRRWVGELQDHRRRRRGSEWLRPRSEEHTSELQYANISYAVFCLKKKKRSARVLCTSQSIPRRL